MTDLEIKKANLRAARLAAGMPLEYAPRGQAPDGALESDYRYRKFQRHHRLRAA
jgi:hypothetical protein